MKKKLNGLIITYCYPPYESPESFVTYKFVNALSHHCNLTILKPRIDDAKTINKNILKTNIKEIEVIIPNYIKKILNIKRLPIRPDRFLFYYPFFKRMLLKINIKSFDFLMTRSQFHSSHLLGLFIRNRSDIPWFAHFSDPWHNNPVQKQIFILEKISLLIQQLILSKTDVNMFPLKELKDYFNKQSKTDINKNSIIVPHSITKLIKTNKKDTKKVTIRFFGKVYAGRKVKNSLIALSNLMENNRNISGEFFVDDDFFINYKYMIKKYSKIKFLSYLNYSSYLKKLNETSILILIDIDQNFGNLFFQSKLVDYLQSYRPILHIGKSLTFNKKIVLRNNGLSCQNDPVQIYKSLSKLIKKLPTFKPNHNLIDSFSSEKIALKVLKKIENTVKDDCKKL